MGMCEKVFGVEVRCFIHPVEELNALSRSQIVFGKFSESTRYSVLCRSHWGPPCPSVMFIS
jgi:hypothetical protein